MYHGWFCLTSLKSSTDNINCLEIVSIILPRLSLKSRDRPVVVNRVTLKFGITFKGVVYLTVFVDFVRFVVVINLESLREQEDGEAEVDDPQNVAAHRQRSHHAGGVLSGDKNRHGTWHRTVEADVKAVRQDCVVVDNEHDEQRQINHRDGDRDKNPNQQEQVQVSDVAFLDI